MWVTSLGLAGEAGIFASLPFYPMFSGPPNGPLRLSPPQVHAAVYNSGAMKTARIGFAVRLPAAAAVFALLVITTAAAAPGLFHGDGLDHCCEFCHLGHLPILKPGAGVTYYAPPSLAVTFRSEAAPQQSYFSLSVRHSRAPPA